MSIKEIRCNKCGKQYTYKTNMIVCPQCRKLINITAVEIEDFSIAIKYIKLQGFDLTGKKNSIPSILGDIYGDHDDIKLIRNIYKFSSVNVATYVTTLQSKGDIRGATKIFVKNLHSLFWDKNTIEKITVAFLGAYNFSPDSYLGGSQRLLIKNLSHSLHRDDFVGALKSIQRDFGSRAWEDLTVLSKAIPDYAPQLREEQTLVDCIGNIASKEVLALAKKISAADYQKDNEKYSVAALISKLLDEHIDSIAIDFFLDSILTAAGLEYTQHVVKPTLPPELESVTSTESQKQNESNDQEKTTQTTANVAISQSIDGATSKVNTRKSPGKKLNFKKILLFIIIADFLLFWPPVQLVNRIAPVFSMIKESNTATTKDTDTEENVDAESETDDGYNIYGPPEVYSNESQIGWYWTNLIRQSQYNESVNPSFSFSYPRVLYEKVDYSNENDGEDIDIKFYCSSDPSQLILTSHPLDEKLSSNEEMEAYKNEIMNEARAALTGVEVLNDKQTAAASGNISNALKRFSFRLKGRDIEDPSIVVYLIYKISSSTIKTMTIKYPEATNDEDLAVKEYYAECMYDLCSFGGNIEVPEWKTFRKPYNVTITM